MQEKIPPIQTILSEAKALPDEDRRKLASEWANRTLEELLAYADYDPSFAEKLCINVADKYGKHEALSALLLGRLRTDRRGERQAPRTKWTKGRYQHLLMLYNLEMRRDIDSREVILDRLAEIEGLTGDNRGRKIQAKITEARKLIPDSELPEHFRSPNLRNKED